jgi:AraC-like DNA-binding protein
MKASRELVRSDSRRSFFVQAFRQPRFDCPYHYHPEIELTWIMEGYGQRLVGDHLAPFKTGDLVLLGANLPHTYFHPPGYQRGKYGAQAAVIQFKKEILRDLLDSPECRHWSRLFSRAARGWEITGSTRTQVTRLMERLVATDDWRRWCLLLEILGLIADSRPGRMLASAVFVPEGKPQQTQRIERVCAWITQHFREPVTLTEAARQAHMSPPAFSTFFRRATNRTFIHFVHELRIGQACRLLLETDQSIAQIAFESGFENLSNFNRRFQELRRLTPREYRSQLSAR